MFQIIVQFSDEIVNNIKTMIKGKKEIPDNNFLFNIFFNEITTRPRRGKRNEQREKIHRLP